SSRSYYDAAGRLRVTNTHDGIHAATGPGGVWEEYRYDALGRRVLVRSRRLAGTVPQPGGAGNPWSYTERTLWDGDRIVAELRGDGSGGATVGDIESPGTGGIVQNGDAPWGSVQYIHALGSAASGGIDMPVQIERDAVYSGNKIRFSPLVNWRGQVQGAALAPGSGDVPSVWPAARLTLDGLPAETDPNYFWLGSLTTGMTDGSGLQYRRNRYYDPETGRFTQSDPIGIAGGINLYGFAGGDPVNFADPFGLCATPESLPVCIAAANTVGTSLVVSGKALATGAVATAAALKTTAVAIGQTATAVGEAAEVAVDALNGAGRRLSIAYARRKAVATAWKEEAAMVRSTGSGTRGWSRAEMAELLWTCRVA